MENSKEFKNLNELFENYYIKKKGKTNKKGANIYISEKSKKIIEHISDISGETMKNLFDIILDDFIESYREIIKNAEAEYFKKANDVFDFFYER